MMLPVSPRRGAAREQRGVDRERRVLRGRSDERHRAVLDVRQQAVLLRHERAQAEAVRARAVVDQHLAAIAQMNRRQRCPVCRRSARILAVRHAPKFVRQRIADDHVTAGIARDPDRRWRHAQQHVELARMAHDFVSGGLQRRTAALQLLLRLHQRRVQLVSFFELRGDGEYRLAVRQRRRRFLLPLCHRLQPAAHYLGHVCRVE